MGDRLMYFAVVSANNHIIACKPFVGIAAEAASKLYPVRGNILNRDVDRLKREKAEAAIAAVLREIALEAARH